MDCRGLRRRDFPVALEAAEVVQPDDIAGFQRRAHAPHPPVIAAAFESVPAIERVSPALPGFAEGIGRNASYHRWLQIVIKMEKVGIAPDIGAVIIHKNGYVAHDPDSPLRAVFTQRPPLFVERKLDGALHFQLTLIVHAELVQPFRFAPR